MYFPYGGGHANIVKCLYKGLESNPDIAQKIVALTVSWRVFRDNQIPFVQLSDYKDYIKDWKDIDLLGKELSKKITFENPDLQYEDYCSYLGIGYYCLIKELGEKLASERYAKEGRKAFCPVYVMKEILQYEMPDAVIITCGVRTEKAVGIAANELGIPVIRIADLPEFEPSGCLAYTCVMNAYAKRYATDVLKEADTRVFITGQPVFENNFIMDERINQGIRDDLKLDKYHKMIVYLEEPGLPELRKVEDQLIRMADDKKDWLFIIKQHPNQNEECRVDLPMNVKCLKKYPLNYLLKNCDLAITRDSTAGMEAALLGKPLINLELYVTDNGLYPLSFDYERFGISHKVTDLGELPKEIDRCLDSDDVIYKKLEEGRTQFKNSENASQNVLNVIRTAWSDRFDYLSY